MFFLIYLCPLPLFADRKSYSDAYEYILVLSKEYEEMKYKAGLNDTTSEQNVFLAHRHRHSRYSALCSFCRCVSQ